MKSPLFAFYLERIVPLSTVLIDLIIEFYAPYQKRRPISGKIDLGSFSPRVQTLSYLLETSTEEHYIRTTRQILGFLPREEKEEALTLETQSENTYPARKKNSKVIRNSRSFLWESEQSLLVCDGAKVVHVLRAPIVRTLNGWTLWKPLSFSTRMIANLKQPNRILWSPKGRKFLSLELDSSPVEIKVWTPPSLEENTVSWYIRKIDPPNFSRLTSSTCTWYSERALTIEGDEEFLLFDLASFKEIERCPKWGPVLFFSWNHNREYLYYGRDSYRTIQRWKAGSKEVYPPLKITAQTLGIDPGEREIQIIWHPLSPWWLLFFYPQRVIIYDLQSEKVIRTFWVTDGTIRDARLAPDGVTIAYHTGDELVVTELV